MSGSPVMDQPMYLSVRLCLYVWVGGWVDGDPPS